MSPTAASARSPECYWADSRRPLASLLFLLPLLAIYEAGAIVCSVDAITARNGADSWLRSGLLETGLVNPWFLPALIVGVLVAWHLWRRDPWRCSLDTLAGMFSESLLFSLVLVVGGQALHLAFRRAGMDVLQAGGPPGAAVIPRAVGFLGAGIYEEVLFRLLLIPATYGGLRLLLIPRRGAVCGAVVLTSLVFAAAHYLEPVDGRLVLTSLPDAFARVGADRRLWFSFAFRAGAGLFFACLFALRGFGIAVGCHTLYDLLVGIVLNPDS